MNIVELSALSIADLVQRASTGASVEWVLFNGSHIRGIADDTEPAERNPFTNNSQRARTTIFRANGTMPSVICPGINLIVGREPYAALKSLFPIQFLPVALTRYVDFDVDKYYADVAKDAYTYATDALEGSPVCSEFSGDDTLYWEMLEPRHEDLPVPNDAVPVEFFDDFECEDSTVYLSKSFFQKYPSTNCGYSHFMTAEMFDVLAPFIDSDFFRTREITI